MWPSGVPLIFEEIGWISWYWNGIVMPQLYNIGHWVNGCCDIMMGA